MVSVQDIPMPHSQAQLQSDLQTISNWGQYLGMWFNIWMCNIMRISWKANICYDLNDSVLSEVQGVKYLGVSVTNNIKLCQIYSVATKAHHRLCFLKYSLCGGLYKCNNLAYLSLVRFQLEYYFSIWDTTEHDIDQLEHVQCSKRGSMDMHGFWHHKRPTALQRPEIGWSGWRAAWPSYHLALWHHR